MSVLHAIVMLVTDRKMERCACFSQKNAMPLRSGKPDALKAKMQAAGRSETRRTGAARLHDGYAGRLSRIGSGNRDLVDIKEL